MARWGWPWPRRVPRCGSGSPHGSPRGVLVRKDRDGGRFGRLERHKRARERLLAEHNREPSEDELARELELSATQYRRFFGGALPGAANGLRPRGCGEESSSLDVVADTQSDAPGEKLSRDELLRLVAQRLTEQEYRIVYLKYWEELSMREIGQLEGLSESRVCKIHLRLLGRLKDRLRSADA
jgi:RNA polymerase sigma factor FliA